MNELLSRHLQGLDERGDAIYYLWTNLWAFWPGACSRHSRAFTPGHDHGLHPAPKELFARTQNITVEPLLPEAQQRQVDLRFVQMLETLGTSKWALAIVLTDASAEQTAAHYYVYYEPCANLVLALNPTEQQVTIHADSELLATRKSGVTTVLTNTGQLLKHQRVTEALLSGIDGACALLTRAR